MAVRRPLVGLVVALRLARLGLVALVVLPLVVVSDDRCLADVA